MDWRRLTLVLAPMILLVILHCDEGNYGGDGDGDVDSDVDGDGDSDVTWQCFSANDCAPGYYCDEFHRCVQPPVVEQPDAGLDGDVGDAEPWVPPEVELEFGPPSSGDRFVYVALLELDSVARVDSVSLDVTSVAVGHRPSALATAPGQDVAVAINSGSDSVSILRVVDGEDVVVTLPTPPQLNRLVVAPTGDYAIAYFELLSPDAEDIGSFQDVALIRLTEGEEAVFGVSVGFRPREVVFEPRGEAAYVITEDGVSTLDLTDVRDGFIAPTVALRLDPFEEREPDEVIVSPDGRFVFTRWNDRDILRSVELETGEIIDTVLGGVPTDIDLTPEGDRLIAVVRELSQLVIMLVPESIGEPESLTVIDCAPLTVGSAVITSDGARALLFTNALNQRAMMLVDLESGRSQVTLLRKGVRSVALSPDGMTAIILHNKTPGDPEATDDFQTQLDRRYGFSMLDLDSLFAKLQITEADPGAFTFLPDSAAAYLIVADRATGVRQIAVADLESYIVDTFAMGSHPLELGNVPGTGRVYVSQDHAIGRISFIDVASGEVRTVTGFQLNSGITE
jgi:DNA-binding beta-propeller fold protein YncE